MSASDERSYLEEVDKIRDLGLAKLQELGKEALGMLKPEELALAFETWQELAYLAADGKNYADLHQDIQRRLRFRIAAHKKLYLAAEIRGRILLRKFWASVREIGIELGKVVLGELAELALQEIRT